MPFYIRKAISLGPLRFNLSKSGLGVSFGVRGLRVGSGAKGNYIHAGRAGVYYRKTLPGRPIASATAFRDLGKTIAPLPSESNPAPENAANSSEPTITEFESGSALRMVDATSEELLEELNTKRTHTDTWPWIVGGTIAVVIGLGSYGAERWILICAATIGFALSLWRYHKDQTDRYVVSMYELDGNVEKSYRDLCAVFEELAASGDAWHVSSEQSESDSKSSSGATSTITRNSILTSVGAGPVHLRTNISVPMLPVGKQKLFFLPDRILVDAPEGYGAVRYSDLAISTEKRRFIESGELPKGAEVVGKTWLYVNKSGEPDQRFKDNREIPIVVYERLHFRSPSGLNEVVQFAQPEISRRLQQALRELA